LQKERFQVFLEGLECSCRDDVLIGQLVGRQGG